VRPERFQFPRPFSPNRTGVIIFTSGTTGTPKGIEVSWRKLFDVGIMSTAILNYGENDVGYACMPLNHSNSLYLNFIPALLNGAKAPDQKTVQCQQFRE
jgi:long-subunit acyl-CoA synthetase (AMP-forming)